MQISYEAIYRSLFIQTRGVLKKELTAQLRTERRTRRSKNHNAKSGQGHILDMVSIRAAAVAANLAICGLGTDTTGSVRYPSPVRIRCAVAALPFEAPKLAVTAFVNEQDFATILDRRIKMWEARERTQPQTIEAPKPLPRSNDRRFRRF
jgi:hypothetical protein